MKKFLFFGIIVAGVVLFAVACSGRNDVPQTDARLYFVDARLNRLLPYSDTVTDGSSEDMARDAVKKLIEGRDDNDGIRRIIPNIKDCISVRVSDNIAYVDISSEIKSEILYSRDIEKLFIYQIVNTVTSIKGIRFVKFTVDGAVHKDFIGFYDMREAYKFTYPE